MTIGCWAVPCRWVQQQAFGVVPGASSSSPGCNSFSLSPVIGWRGADCGSRRQLAAAQRQQRCEQLKAGRSCSIGGPLLRCRATVAATAFVSRPQAPAAYPQRPARVWLRYPPAVSLLPVWHRQAAPDRAKHRRVSACRAAPQRKAAEVGAMGVLKRCIVTSDRPAAGRCCRPDWRCPAPAFPPPAADSSAASCLLRRIVLRQRHLRHQIVGSEFDRPLDEAFDRGR